MSRRPTLWSYISFGSTQPESSYSLPTQNHNTFAGVGSDKVASPKRGILSGGRADAYAMNGGQRSRLMKGTLLFFVLILLYLITTRNTSSILDIGKGQTSTKPTGGDPNSPLETAKCSKSYTKGKPLIQYALMIDAGSTGSRIHVYRFNNCGSTPELESEEFAMTEKKEGGSGLSSYESDAEGAAKSLDVLLDVAMKHVPEELKSCTPIAVKATAGLRKLGEEMSAKILAAVRSRLETAYPFPVVSDANGGVEVMDGKDEGVYAWITTNYLLGKIGGPDKSPTAAVFDLGGGSTQIVFEPTFKQSPSGGMPEVLQDGDHKYIWETSGQKYELYQHSHLGYGLMAAREAIHNHVVASAAASHKTSNAAGTDDFDPSAAPIANPCIIPGMHRSVNVTLPDGKTYPTTMEGPRTPSPAQCRGLAEKILQKDAPCTLAPCSFNGIHQPSLAKTFAREDVYIFSYFYDRTQPLGMPESFTIRELMDLTASVCAGEKEGWGVFAGVEGAVEELRGRPEYCLDLSFMVGLLHTGYEMGLEREVRIAKKIKGNELGWCLGASLPLLNQESGWTCKMKQVA